MAKNKTKSQKQKNNHTQEQGQIKTGYRIGALVLVATIIVSMLAVYVL
ncbi:MAG: hypothetical protein Q4C55_06500 [Eubacterium sp.]|nr:hypothetical protein [Eubacterium sp.]